MRRRVYAAACGDPLACGSLHRASPGTPLACGSLHRVTPETPLTCNTLQPALLTRESVVWMLRGHTLGRGASSSARRIGLVRERAQVARVLRLVDRELRERGHAQVLPEALCVETDRASADARAQLAVQLLETSVAPEQRAQARELSSLVLGAEPELAFDDRERVDGDAGVERGVSFQPGHGLALDELAHRGDELDQGGVVVHRRSPQQQVQQIDLRLRRAAPDRRALDGAVDSALEHAVLHHAHDSPLERSEDLPQAHALGIDAAAPRGLVAGEEILAPAEAADGRLGAEAPRVHADPAEVFHRIALVRDLPVQHTAHALRVDQQVAVAE